MTPAGKWFGRSGWGWKAVGFIIAVTLVVTAYAAEPSPEQASPRSSDGEVGRPVPADVLPQPVPPPVTLFAVGDIMLDRNVEAMMEKNGAAYPFERMRSVWQGSDIVFANLEGPIVLKHVRTPSGTMRFSFSEDRAALLREQGITTVSIANNHSFDHGAAGYQTTKDFLAASSVEFFGNAREISNADVLRKTVHDRPFVFVGYSSAVNAGFDPAAAEALVASLASQPDLTVVVSIHWGNEYQLTAGTQQTVLARRLIDAGADLILGHHPHVVQNIEAYRNRLIFYSLGNFIFDQYFSKETQEELAVRCRLSEEDHVCDLLPVASVKSQPAPIEEPQRAVWLDALARRSSPELGGQIRAGQIRVSLN